MRFARWVFTLAAIYGLITIPLTYFIEPMYSLTDGTYAVNGGAELRLFGSWSAVANAIVSKQSGVFVGLSKSF